MRGSSEGGARIPALHWTALVLLLAAAIGTQVAADGAFGRFDPARSVLWVQSPAVMRRLTLGFDAVAADVYWIRAVQYYGNMKLSSADNKNYDLLYPLLDMTTTLDPLFKIAFRFGAILLSEDYPNGPGRPREAIALLEKGIRQAPERWEYYHDAGFVEYWWRQDYEKGADWLLRASKVPGAPDWLPQVAASMLAEGGVRDSARVLWSQLAEAEQDWLRQMARRGLMQLEAESHLEQLQMVVNRFYDDAGRFPTSWNDLVRAGRLPGIPLDPSGVAYAIDPVSGAVDVARTSQLFPLRRGRVAVPPA
jgi:hypothetical protein